MSNAVAGATLRGLVGAIFLAAAMRPAAAQQDVPPDRAQLASAVRADLTRLAELERAYFGANQHYTTDLKLVHFSSTSGALIAVSYASARSFSASAEHVRLAPYLCFVIVANGEPDSPAEKPFCTDSRFGKAATALAHAATEVDSPTVAATRKTTPSPSRVMPVTKDGTPRASPAAVNGEPALTEIQFADRLRAAASAANDSVEITVKYAVRDARYDPTRGVLEVAVDRVLLPLARSPAGDTGPARLALACFVRPAFVCGAAGLTYIARDLIHLPRSVALTADELRSGLTLEARFAIGRRDDSVGPALTLLSLAVRSKGEVLGRWDTAPGR
jgi:hypothetical protein